MFLLPGCECSEPPLWHWRGSEAARDAVGGQDCEDPNGGSPLGLPNDLQCLTDANWVVKVSLSLAQVSSSQSRVSLMLGPRVLCTEIPRPLAPTGSFPEEGFLGAVALKIPHRLPAA